MGVAAALEVLGLRVAVAGTGVGGTRVGVQVGFRVGVAIGRVTRTIVGKDCIVLRRSVQLTSVVALSEAKLNARLYS